MKNLKKTFSMLVIYEKIFQKYNVFIKPIINLFQDVIVKSFPVLTFQRKIAFLLLSVDRQSLKIAKYL